ncbi:hypothetical protein BGZ60DRAFT_536104 [Tricladium varicosporioides]|nr:hypothetical protein BGZ60DRAFT_536104 [Hymenoscyphus varicosporioides]
MHSRTRSYNTWSNRPSKNTSPQRSHLQKSTTCRSRTSSFNLFSLISKFEALDALSLPCRNTALQPVPLRMSQNSTRSKDRITSKQMKKLSTIFSPGEENVPQLVDSMAENLSLLLEKADLPNMQNTTKVDSTVKRSIWRKSRKSISSNTSTVSTIPPKIRDPNRPRKRSGSSMNFSQQQTTTQQKRQKSIKDIIRFYDGAVASGKHTTAKPSLAPTPRKTPYAIDLRRDPRHEILSPTAYSPYISQSSIKSKAPSLNKESPYPSPTKTSIRMNSQNQCGEEIISQSKSRSNSKPKAAIFRRRSILGSFTNMTANEGGTDRQGRTRKRENSISPTKRHVNGHQINSTRKEFGEKIEALYHAKSMERQSENPLKQMQNLSANSHKIDHALRKGKRGRKASHGWFGNSGQSKVAEMRKMFDQRFSSKNQILRTASTEVAHNPSMYPTKICSDIKTVDNVLLPPSSPPVPPPMPVSIRKRTSAISPKTIMLERQPIQLKAYIPPINCPKPASNVEHSPRSRSKVIEDRIGLLERAKTHDLEKKCHKKERSFSNMLGNSIIKARRSFFDSTTRKNAEKPQGLVQTHSPEKLSGKETVNEAFDGAVIGFDTNAKQVPCPFQAYLEVQRPISPPKPVFEDPEVSELNEMIVKEAQCEVQEPKPMRVSEMKRMMLLCRDKAGRSLDKETSKGRAGYPRSKYQ